MKEVRIRPIFINKENKEILSDEEARYFLSEDPLELVENYQMKNVCLCGEGY